MLATCTAVFCRPVEAGAAEQNVCLRTNRLNFLSQLFMSCCEGEGASGCLLLMQQKTRGELSRFVCEHVPINETEGHVIIGAVMVKAPPERVAIPIKSSVSWARSDRRFLKGAGELRS